MLATALFQLQTLFAPATLLALIVAAGCLWLAVDYGFLHRHYWLSAAFLLLGLERLLAVYAVVCTPATPLCTALAGCLLIALAVVLLRVVVGRLLWLAEDGAWPSATLTPQPHRQRPQLACPAQLRPTLSAPTNRRAGTPASRCTACSAPSARSKRHIESPVKRKGARASGRDRSGTRRRASGSGGAGGRLG